VPEHVDGAVRPHGGGQQVDARAADELRDLDRGGARVQLRRRAELQDRSASIIATRSDMVIASTWSCVT
jgi:hypothetical protein